MTSRIDKRVRCGFTLVELLIVIVIIGVMATLIGPTFTSGSNIARVKTASRGVIQMSRYARTMALLHQTPVELVYTSDGTLRVEQVTGGGESIVSAKAFASTNAAVDAEAEPVLEEEGVAAQEGVAESGGASYVMADLNIENKYDGVGFVFNGYTDSMEDGHRSRVGEARSAPEAEEEGEGEIKAFRVRYKSNGTCRPYSVRLTSGGEEAFALTVVIDVLGSAKVEEDDE
ncbi:MAG: prepilin-type N-terminal cleavage/methylation domain-containing protein [bacterium]